MNIGIIGSGNVASALRTLFEAAGHDVVVGSRSPATERATVSITQAAAQAEVVILAIPYVAAADLLPELASALNGKVVIDLTNPLNADCSPRLLGQHNSAGEEIARLLPGSRVVKAFNTVFADVMTSDRLLRGGQRATAFIAGDDAHTTNVAAALADSAGFAAVKVGPLSASRYLESMAHMNIGIAIGQKGGTNAAFVYHQAA